VIALEGGICFNVDVLIQCHNFLFTCFKLKKNIYIAVVVIKIRKKKASYTAVDTLSNICEIFSNVFLFFVSFFVFLFFALGLKRKRLLVYGIMILKIGVSCLFFFFLKVKIRLVRQDFVDQ